jgi:DHA3 family macrolide efflux protein-like MFS transporter
MLDTEKSNLKGYLLIWFGQLVSLFGSGVVQFAIIWWITTETGSTFRKTLILGTDFLQAFFTFFLVILFSFRIIGIYIIIPMLFFRGMFQALQLPATIALVPQMVPKKKISRMNGLNSIFNNIIYILTPVTGAVFLEITTIEFILIIDLVTFLLAAGSILIVKIPYHKKKKEKNPASVLSSIRKDFSDCIDFLRSNGYMSLIIGGMFANILINPLFTLLPYFVKHIHLGEALELALILGFFQMGSLLGGLIIIVKNFQPQFGNVVFAVFVAFCGLFIISIAPVGFFPILVVGSLIAGLSIGTVDIMIVTILQVNIPSEFQGRVFSILFMLVKSILPIAILITGILAEIVGISIIYLVNPILGFLLVAYLFLGGKISTFDQNLKKNNQPSIQIA